MTTTDDLAIARSLAEAGVPIFLARRADTFPFGGHRDTGYLFPRRWQETAADPAALDAYEPGMAVCAVGGHGVDFLDIDVHKRGAESLAGMNGTRPRAYGKQRTPSGGQHDLIASIGARSRDGFRPGLDFKGGVGGKGLGFVFLAPTEKRSKVDGAVRPYRWGQAPDLTGIDRDDSGAALARELLRLHDDRVEYDGPDHADLPADRRAWADRYVAEFEQQWRGRLAGVLRLPESQTDEHGHGWERAATNCAFEFMRVALAPWSGWDLDDAREAYERALPPAIANNPDCKGKWDDGRVSRAAGEPCWEAPWASAEGDFSPEPGEDDGPSPAPEDRFEREVARQVERLRVQAEARQRIAAEDAAQVSLPDLVGLDDLLAQPDEDAAYRVEGLWPADGRVLLAAQYKAGKTTLVANLVRSLADGDPFLGAFAVERAARVALLDNESTPKQIRHNLGDQGIGAPGRVRLMSLRGRLSSFNIVDPAVRALWAERVRGCDVLVFDCLRPALDALGLSEDKDAGRFLEALDELAYEAGVREVMLVHHMGHSGERSRGDSRLLDWPDANWKVVRTDADDPASQRFMSAYGRDVDMPEIGLAFSAADRRLTLGSGSRKAQRAASIDADVLGFVETAPGCTKSAVEAALAYNANDVRAAIRRLVDSGALRDDRVGRASHLTAVPEFVQEGLL